VLVLVLVLVYRCWCWMYCVVLQCYSGLLEDATADAGALQCWVVLN
jgi:hypothetical protein